MSPSPDALPAETEAETEHAEEGPVALCERVARDMDTLYDWLGDGLLYAPSGSDTDADTDADTGP